MLRDLFSLFPAYAGVIPVLSEMMTSQIAFPRIRGGDPQKSMLEQMGYNFSPHTRG